MSAKLVCRTLLVALQSLLICGAAAAADPAIPVAPPHAPSEAQTKRPPAAEVDAETYARCMKFARQDPRTALAVADAWRQRGGAHPADHCAAVALIALGRYQEGATRLQALAQAMTTAPASLLADVLDQASQAWLLAGNPARAFEVAREAAAVAPNDLEILIDRAEAAAAAGYLDAAVADLDRVLKADPNRVDALIYRASANRALDRLDPARSDIDKALALAPRSAAALLERGNIRQLEGDSGGALRDWQESAHVAPGSPEDMAARANIEHVAKIPGAVPPPKPVGKVHGP